MLTDLQPAAADQPPVRQAPNINPSRVSRLIRQQRLREYFAFDATMYRKAVAVAGVASGVAALSLRRGREALKILAKIHRSAYARSADRTVEWLLCRAWAGSRFEQPLRTVCGPDEVEMFLDGPARKFLTDPAAMLGPLAMVLRSPGPGYKGVILLQYNFVFPLFRRLFDVDRIAERYHVILEPSWSGYCNHEVLCYAGIDSPVFVQAYEPRDREFIDGLGTNLVSVPTAANWWVDHRIFRPVPAVEKDADIVMVAGWGDYKRHGRFFEAIRPLRDSKPDLKIILIGYDLGLTADDIRALAAHYGLLETIEVFENLTQEQVNAQMNRARVNVLWSRKEGVNKAIIEGMFANLPCVIREGFNYGHQYEYVNDATGAIATEESLPGVVFDLLRRSPTMAPREWVLRHMSCQVSTTILADVIARLGGDTAPAPPLTVKVNGLHGMHYWDPSDGERFHPDHEYLRTAIR